MDLEAFYAQILGIIFANLLQVVRNQPLQHAHRVSQIMPMFGLSTETQLRVYFVLDTEENKVKVALELVAQKG